MAEKEEIRLADPPVLRIRDPVPFCPVSGIQDS